MLPSTVNASLQTCATRSLGPWTSLKGRVLDAEQIVKRPSNGLDCSEALWTVHMLRPWPDKHPRNHDNSSLPRDTFHERRQCLTRRRFDQDLPDSIRQGLRLTTRISGHSRFLLAPSSLRIMRSAKRQDGVWLPELLRHLRSVAHKLCFVHSMHTDAINHEPGITFFHLA